MMECEQYINNAIEYCLTSIKEYKTREDIIACLKTQNSLIHSKFRFSIAKDIASFLLTRYSSQIKDLKLYGSTAEYMAGIYSDIDLIIHVSNVNDELLKSLKLLNGFLAENYYLLIGASLDEYSYFIDIHIINDDPLEPRHPSRAYLEHIMFNEAVPLCG